MSGNTRFTLAYCSENQWQAQKIDEILSRAGISFSHLACGTAAEKFSSSLQNAEKPVILLLSDNFLKSAPCLNETTSIIQQMIRGEELLPVIIDGVYSKDDGSRNFVKTSFDRVSHVLNYMNFWQDKYLTIRKKKRNFIHQDNEILESQIEEETKVIQSISATIGEFLRFFRHSEHYTYPTFSANHFAVFFEKYGLQELHARFSALPIPEMEHLQEHSNSIDKESYRPTSIPAVDPIQSAATPSLSTEAPEDNGVPLHADGEPPSVLEELLVVPEEDMEEEINPAIEEPLPPTSSEEPPQVVEISGSSEEESPEFAQAAADSTHQIETLLFGDDDNEEETFPEKETETTINEGHPEEGLYNNPHPEPQVAWEDNITENPAIDQDHGFIEDDGGKYAFTPEEKTAEAEKWEGESSEIPIGNFYIDDLGDDSIEDKIIDSDEDEEDDWEQDSTEQIIDDEPEQAEEEPEDEFRHIMLSAEYLLHAGETEQGLRLLETAVKSKPENKSYRMKLANALLEYRQDREATANELQAILNMDPTYFPALLKQAELAEDNGDFSKALELYVQVSHLKPKMRDLDYKIGLLLQGHFPQEKERAARSFQKAIKQDKTNVDATYRYASLLAELKPDKTEKIEKLYKRCLKLSPDHPFASYDLALLFYRQESWKKAAKYYLKAAGINPELRTPQNDEAFGIGPNGELPEFQTKPEEKVPAQPESSQVVCITGATSGIGKALAYRFAHAGFRLLLTGRRFDRLEQVKDDLEKTLNADIEILHFDVRDAAGAQLVFENLPEAWKNVDILINNAGLAKGLAPIHEGDTEHWNTMIDTNIKGLLQMTRMIAPHMVTRRKGHIVNISSIAGKEVYPNGNVYAATKHAVDALTRSMQLDLHKHHVRVSQVSPGHVEETEFALVRFDGDAEKARIYEDFRPLTAADVAEAVYFIVSQPPHVMIRDIVLTSTQQASAMVIDRSGRP